MRSLDKLPVRSKFNVLLSVVALGHALPELRSQYHHAQRDQ